MKCKILVIEDNQKHLEDAKKYFADKQEVDVVYAENYSEAKGSMIKWDFDANKEVKGDIDGIIADIYFPLSEEKRWNQPEPIGVRVAIEAIKLGIPFVLNTAGFHHGRKYEQINGLARGQGWDLVDPEDHRDYEKDAVAKNWEKAYENLEAKLK